MVNVIDGDATLEDLDDEELDEERPFKEVVKEMAGAAVYGFEPADIPGPPSISSMFDQGAKLNLHPPKATPVKGDVTTAKPKKDKKTAPERRNERVAGGELFADLFATGLIALVTFSVGDWALPTEEEARDISVPLGNIIARRIDLAAKLGRDANDTVAILVGLMVYMVRVGPLAAERMKVSIAERRARERVVRVPTAGVRPDGQPSSGMAHGGPAPESSAYGAAHNPLDAITAARTIGRSYAGNGSADVAGIDLAMGH